MLKVAKVSVIIPTYNRAEFLRSAITSVLNRQRKSAFICVRPHFLGKNIFVKGLIY